VVAVPDADEADGQQTFVPAQGPLRPKPRAPEVLRRAGPRVPQPAAWCT
jgi:hypothetical protein